MLYEDIVNMYGHDWVEEEIDVDLPFVISKKKTPDNVRYKNDFTDNRLTMNDAMDELLSKLDVAIDDMEQGRVQPIDDAWKEINRI